MRRAAEILEIDASPANLSGRGRMLDEKALLVWLVKTHTAVSNAWVSERLRTGHPTAVSKPPKLELWESFAKRELCATLPEGSAALLGEEGCSGFQNLCLLDEEKWGLFER